MATFKGDLYSDQFLQKPGPSVDNPSATGAGDSIAGPGNLNTVQFFRDEFNGALKKDDQIIIGPVLPLHSRILFIDVGNGQSITTFSLGIRSNPSLFFSSLSQGSGDNKFFIFFS